MRRLLTLAFCLTAPLFSQTRGVAKTGLNLRSGAGKSHGIKGSVAAGDTLALLAPHPTTHYYHVRIPAGTAGWVWERGVQLLSDSGGPSPEPTPALSDSTNWIDSLAAWSKPMPQELSSGPCVAAGAAAPSSPARPDTGTDLRKNRIDESPSSHDVAAAAILGLPWSGHPPRRYHWKHGDTVAVRTYEGVAIAVAGYLAGAKEEGKEMTNCEIDTHDWHDWHLWLVATAAEASGPPPDKTRAIVVEATPRVRTSHPGWSLDSLKAFHNRAAQVRISGWLMFDPDHPSDVGSSRGTIWEIHPIMKIEVRDGAGWRNLDAP